MAGQVFLPSSVTHAFLLLPELLRETVTFPCGIQVELRFREVFSNVMHVSAKLQAPPPHIADVRLLLCRPAVSSSTHPQGGCGASSLNSPLPLLSRQAWEWQVGKGTRYIRKRSSGEVWGQN